MSGMCWIAVNVRERLSINKPMNRCPIRSHAVYARLNKTVAILKLVISWYPQSRYITGHIYLFNAPSACIIDLRITRHWATLSV